MVGEEKNRKLEEQGRRKQERGQEKLWNREDVENNVHGLHMLERYIETFGST